MSAILTLPITCSVCGERRMMKLRPGDAWECPDCARRSRDDGKDAPPPLKAAS